MFVLCHIDEQILCRSIHIYYATWIELITNKPFLFLCKNIKNRFNLVGNHRFWVIYRWFINGLLVQKKMNLDWANRSVFTGKSVGGGVLLQNGFINSVRVSLSPCPMYGYLKTQATVFDNNRYEMQILRASRRYSLCRPQRTQQSELRFHNVNGGSL